MVVHALPPSGPRDAVRNSRPPASLAEGCTRPSPSNYSASVTEAPRTTDFVALGRPGNERYAGLETFENPGVSEVELLSDELTAVCPITNQPDLYRLTIDYEPDGLCLESKSVKLYLMSFRNEGVFCEALAMRIRDDIAAALEVTADRVHVALEQKARGGITITARV
jgi:7-cyano-7-deazaguanine reductase